MIYGSADRQAAAVTRGGHGIYYLRIYLILLRIRACRDKI